MSIPPSLSPLVIINATQEDSHTLEIFRRCLRLLYVDHRLISFLQSITSALSGNTYSQHHSLPQSKADHPIFQREDG